MSGILAGLIVGAALWLVVFVLIFLFSGGELKTALEGASGITLALTVIVVVVAVAAWLLSLVFA